MLHHIKIGKMDKGIYTFYMTTKKLLQI